MDLVLKSLMCWGVLPKPGYVTKQAVAPSIIRSMSGGSLVSSASRCNEYSYNSVALECLDCDVHQFSTFFAGKGVLN